MSEPGESRLEAGFAAVPLPYRPGFPLGGYAARRGGGLAAHDRLEVRALTIATSGRRLGLALLDVVEVGSELVVEIRRAASDLGHDDLLIWVAATHTHSGLDPSRLEEGARRGVVRATVDALRKAADDELPVRLRWNSGSVRQLGTIRNRPERGDEVPLGLLRLEGERGQLRGLLLTIDCHPTVLGANNRRASADLPGAVRDQLAEFLSAPAAPWVGVATGAAADVSTRHTRRAATFAELRRFGRLVANRVLELADTAEELGPPSLSWAAEVLELPGRPPLPSVALARLERRLGARRARALALGRPAEERTLETALQGVAIERSRATSVPQVAELAVARLGALALVAVPGELYLEHGRELRRRLHPAIILGYANGYLGYLPPARLYPEPDYEVLASPVGPGAAEQLVETAVRLATSPVDQTLDEAPDPKRRGGLRRPESARGGRR